MTAKSAVFAAAAPASYEFGFNVLPIIQGTKRPSRSWKTWQTRRQTPAELRDLRESYPNHHIAAILGQVSGLVDLDIDDGDVGEESLRAQKLPVPPTAGFTSPGNRQKKPGRHLLYRCRAALVSRRIDAGLELRAERRYSVVPPSPGRDWTLDLEHLSDLPDPWLTPAGANLQADASTKVGPEILVGPIGVPHIGPTKNGPTKPPPALPGGLIELESWPDFLPAVVRLLGLPPDLGRAFPCPLPGHGPDTTPSATLWRFADGSIKLRDWHRRDGIEYLTLAEVYAARVSGCVRSLNGPELAVWKLRLLVDSGLVDPVDVVVPAPPPTASPLAHRAAAGFRRLLGAKWLYTHGAPSPYTRRFVAAWCGISEAHAAVTVRQLRQLGVIRKVGVFKRVALYLPGKLQ